MSASFKFLFQLMSIALFVQVVWGLEIISPQEGETVFAGSELKVIARPDPGEQWENIAFGFFPMTYNPLTNEYSYTFRLREDILGSFDRIVVIGVDKSGNETKLRRTVVIKLPPNVVLKSLQVDDYKTLFKLPPGRSPEEMQRIEARQLHVDGMYSDGVERDLTSSTAGTTYTSKNETVVSVNSEGRMTAQGIGTAKITVTNGSLSADVEVVVKPYKK